jgi:hypothetical protein
MFIAGQTADGTPVMGGLFEMHDTRGLPLSLSLMYLRDKGMVGDLYGYAKDALLHGWTPKSIRVRIREAVVDIHGLAHWLEIEPLLDKVFDCFVPLTRIS